MPEPTVRATAVPNVKAATKLKNAAQMTALARRKDARRHHGRDRIRRVVESVDVVEDQRDQNQRGDSNEQHLCRLPVLDHDAFEHVGGVLAAVGRLLEEVERLLPLDDEQRILLLIEEAADRLLMDPVGFVFERLISTRG
jgi:hypothetical protein